MLRIETFSNGRRNATVLPGWAMGLMGIAAVGLGLVVLTIGAGLALLLAPVVVGGVMLARWRLRKAIREAGIDPATGAFRDPAGPAVIDADYRVVDGDQRR
jgi:hypothetical protein